jgi:hypothetical protein
MTEFQDINDTLQTEGPDAVRARHDRAPKYQRNGKGDTTYVVASAFDDSCSIFEAI